MSDLKLYGFPQSSYVRTARLACEEKGVAYEIVPTQIGSPENLAVHPFGKIPAMSHGDFKCYETAAICRYVDEARVGDETNPEWIVRHQVVVQLLWAHVRVFLQQPVDVVARFGHQIRVEDVAVDGISLAVVLSSFDAAHHMTP